MRNVAVREISTNSGLSRSGLPELRYAFNPYQGCMHGCVYCYAMDFTGYREAAENWGSVIAVKMNILDKLRGDVIKLPRGVVGVSTVTDPYQPLEGKYRLVRRGIEMLSSHGFRVSVQTRSPLFTRDLNIMEEHRGMFDVGMTIASPDPDVTAMIEPGAPSPASRMAALRRASGKGIETWTFIGPIIKGFNDSFDQIDGIVDFAVENRTRIIYDKFSPYRGPATIMKKLFNLDRGEYARSADTEWWKSVSRHIQDRASGSGIDCHPQSEDWLYEKTKSVKPLNEFS